MHTTFNLQRILEELGLQDLKYTGISSQPSIKQKQIIC